MQRTVRSITAVTLFLFAMSFAAPAFAAPASWDRVDITLHTEQSKSVLMVAGELPANAPLPADVELSVPSGGEIQWAGEILGGPVAEDPEVKYTKTAGDGFDIYRFTLTKARVAQIEVVLAGLQTFDGKTYATNLRWVPSQDVPSVRISARVQSGAKIVQSSPDAALLPGDASFGYYSKTVSAVKAGAPVELVFTHEAPGVGATATPAASGSSDIVPVAIISIVAIGALAGMAYGVQRKLAAKAALREAEEEAAGPAPKRARSTKAASADGGSTAKVLSEAFEDEDVPVAAAPKAAKARKPQVAAVVQEPPAPRGLRPQHIVTGVIVLGLAVAVFVLARQATSSAFVGGTLTRSFGGASPCTTVTIPLTPKPGVDFEADAGKLMDSLVGLESLADVTITLQPASIRLGYCDSTISEQQIRDALESAGVATLGTGVSESAEPATGTPAPAQ